MLKKGPDLSLFLLTDKNLFIEIKDFKVYPKNVFSFKLNGIINEKSIYFQIVQRFSGGLEVEFTAVVFVGMILPLVGTYM